MTTDKIKHYIGDHLFNYICSITNPANLERHLKANEAEIQREQEQNGTTNRHHLLTAERHLLKSRLS